MLAQISYAIQKLIVSEIQGVNMCRNNNMTRMKFGFYEFLRCKMLDLLIVSM